MQSNYMLSAELWPLLGGLSRYPFMCSLRSASRKHFCGCSLIAPNAVLTAAHCVDKHSEQYRRPTIQLGRFYRSEADDFEEYATQEVMIHPDWDPSSNANDAAVILLNGQSYLEFVELAEGGAWKIKDPTNVVLSRTGVMIA